MKSEPWTLPRKLALRECFVDLDNLDNIWRFAKDILGVTLYSREKILQKAEIRGGKLISTERDMKTWQKARRLVFSFVFGEEYLKRVGILQKGIELLFLSDKLRILCTTPPVQHFFRGCEWRIERLSVEGKLGIYERIELEEKNRQK